jgi:hypothetical protein
MSPQHKLRIATILMGLGIAPWVFTLGWVAAILLSSVPGHPPRIFMLDPIAMIGVMMMTFAIADTAQLGIPAHRDESFQYRDCPPRLS